MIRGGVEGRGAGQCDEGQHSATRQQQQQRAAISAAAAGRRQPSRAPLSLPLTEPRRRLAQPRDRLGREVRDAERVREAAVLRARVDRGGAAELLQVAQALHRRRVDRRDGLGAERRILVERVAEYLACRLDDKRRELWGGEGGSKGGKKDGGGLRTKRKQRRQRLCVGPVSTHRISPPSSRRLFQMSHSLLILLISVSEVEGYCLKGCCSYLSLPRLGETAASASVCSVQ